jgi:hypothetical protein
VNGTRILFRYNTVSGTFTQIESVQPEEQPPKETPISSVGNNADTNAEPETESSPSIFKTFDDLLFKIPLPILLASELGFGLLAYQQSSWFNAYTGGMLASSFLILHKEVLHNHKRKSR